MMREITPVLMGTGDANLYRVYLNAAGRVVARRGSSLE
jgi:hypothetical protein